LQVILEDLEALQKMTIINKKRLCHEPLSNAHAAFAISTRAAIDTATKLDDVDTADLFAGVTQRQRLSSFATHNHG
jgi:hypothetical protein